MKLDEASLAAGIDVGALDDGVLRCIRQAADAPELFYLFMQRYAHFNGYAGSCVARLASAIGVSRELFRDPACPVLDESDRGLTIARHVFAATIDEHSDAKQLGLPHRTLAQATLKAAGDYCGYSTDQRNAASVIPAWLGGIVAQTLDGYQGRIGDADRLVWSMGFHAASEFLADREYALIDQVVRHERKGEGFSAYMRDRHGKVMHEGHEVSIWYWVGAHGHFGGHGVEADHFDAALDAINLAIAYRPEPAENTANLARQGFGAFAEVQRQLFAHIDAELRTAAESRAVAAE